MWQNPNVNLKHFSTLSNNNKQLNSDENMNCQTERTIRAGHGQVKRLNGWVNGAACEWKTPSDLKLKILPQI